MRSGSLAFGGAFWTVGGLRRIKGFFDFLKICGRN